MLGSPRPLVPRVLLALLLAVAVLLPFHDKAFTIDDTLFLRQAEHVLDDPLHPTAFEMVWSEIPQPTRMSAIMPSGPVMAYLLVPCVLAGGQEWVCHLVPFLLFALGIGATASLALRLGLTAAEAGTAALLLAATPAALAMAGTCMPDVPAMAFGALAIERLVAWRRDRRLQQALAAAVSLAIAVLARSHLLLLWGVGAILLAGGFPLIRRWIGAPRRLWIPLAIAPVLVVTVLLATGDPEASSVPLVGAAWKFSGFKSLVSNLIAFSAHWTFVIPFAIPWLGLHPVRMAKRPFVYAVALAAMIALFFRGEGYRLFLVGAAAGIGLGAVWDVLHDAWRRRDATDLALGSWLLLAAPVVVYVQMPSKYLVASAPAAAILVAKALGERSPGTRRLAAALIVAAGALLGGLVLKADADFADLGRVACRELIAPNIAAGRRVWFAGHWGFQWYAEKAGAWPITVTPPRPLRGDLAVSSLQTFGEIIDTVPDRKRIKSVVGARTGGRIMSFNLGSGFYGNAWGYLPWAWGEEILDQYDLWQLK